MSGLTPKKLFIVNNSEATTCLMESIDLLGEAAGISYYGLQFDSHKKRFSPLARVISAANMTEFFKSDAVVTFGTWGSTHPERGISKIDSNRQALLEHVNRIFASLCQAYNKPMIVFETATLSRIRYNYTGDTEPSTAKGLNPRYVRVGLNHWIYSKARWLDPNNREVNRLKRFRKIFKHNYDIDLPVFEHQWRNKSDGAVLVVAGLEHDPTASMPTLDWITSTVQQLKTITERPIRIRLHPLSVLSDDIINSDLLDERTSFDDPTVRLKNTVSDVYCAVLDSSTSVFELVELGIPVIVGLNNFAQDLCNTDINNIENLYYATPEEVTRWYYMLSWTEFNVTEIQNGELLPYLRELI